MNGDVESNPGPPRVDPMQTESAQQKRSNENVPPTGDANMEDVEGQPMVFQFAGALSTTTLGATESNFFGPIRTPGRSSPGVRNLKGKRPHGDQLEVTNEPQTKNDWEFDGFEDIAHPPPSQQSLMNEQPWKRQDTSGGAKARARELTNALGNSVPLPTPHDPDAVETTLRKPPPCCVRDILSMNIPTLRHVPGSTRPRVQEVFAKILRTFVGQMDMVSLWYLMAFPKLVLRGTGDPSKHPGLDASQIVTRRLDLWEKGNHKDLVEEARKDIEVKRKQPIRAASMAKKMSEKRSTKSSWNL